MFGFISKAIKSAGKGIGAGIHAAASGVGAVGKLAGKVPVVGGGLHGVFNLTVAGPFQIADGIAKGQRIDKVALGQLKNQVSAIKEVAPYAQMVVQVVPGVGQGLSGAIAGGLALAQGQPITKAISEAVKNALPGGPLAKAAFDVSSSIVAGKPIDQVALAALPLPPAQKKALETAVASAKAIAQGKSVSAAAFDAALKQLPADVQKAVSIGVAVGQGQNLQKIAQANVSVDGVANLGKLGASIANANPILKAGGQVLKGATSKQGFAIATGLMNSKGLQPIHVTAIRGKLNSDQKKGFDMALSAHIGLASGAVPKKGDAKAKFGYAVTHGMQGAPANNKTGMMKVIAADPTARAGAVVAVKQIQTKNSAWWRRILKLLHIPVADPSVAA
jgi:hypothetical protein